jgi:hypothetical protein
VLKKHIYKFGRKKVAQYLIQWLGYDPEFDEWKSLNELENCIELVEEFEQATRADPSAQSSDSTN